MDTQPLISILFAMFVYINELLFKVYSKKKYI